MGLSIALAVGIVAIALFTILFTYNFVNNSIYDYVLSRSEISKIDDSISKTIIDIQYPNATAGSRLVSFSLVENGTEKLWNFDKFVVLVTYDADIGGVSTPTTEKLTFNDAQSFAQVGTNIGTAQFARPISDISKGGWTDTVGGDNDGILYDEVNETARSDINYARSASLTLLSPTDTWTAGLSSVIDPQESSNHIVSYVYRKSAAGGVTIDITTRLLQGGTQIASWTHSAVGSSFTLAQQTLTGAQADSITNYSDLRLEFTGTYASGILPLTSADISWANLQVPPTPDGMYDCTNTSISSGQWTIDRITSDNLDPKILNTAELGKICIKLSNNVIAGGSVKIVVSTDNGKTDTRSIVA
ncbi:MAG: hypothetical protein EPO62_00235 [Candidatus Nitrosotenuis sp.]|nr:MAG: hypothetical protein EPO62_00235 [Candidatus Nitrosotenuis sp.]